MSEGCWWVMGWQIREWFTLRSSLLSRGPVKDECCMLAQTEGGPKFRGLGKQRFLVKVG